MESFRSHARPRSSAWELAKFLSYQVATTYANVHKYRCPVWQNGHLAQALPPHGWGSEQEGA